jgi:hypothetical protein
VRHLLHKLRAARPIPHQVKKVVSTEFVSLRGRD